MIDFLFSPIWALIFIVTTTVTRASALYSNYRNSMRQLDFDYGVIEQLEQAAYAGSVVSAQSKMHVELDMIAEFCAIRVLKLRELIGNPY